MTTHIEKDRERGSQAAAHQQQRAEESSFRVSSNHPQAAAQRKLQEMVNHSDQVSQLGAYQALADRGSQLHGAATAVAQRKHTNPVANPIQAKRTIDVSNYRNYLKGASGGNYYLGSADAATADEIGKDWIGRALRGKYNLSADQLRQYRKPTFKPKQGKAQANVEERSAPKGAWTANGHIDITK